MAPKRRIPASSSPISQRTRNATPSETESDNSSDGISATPPHPGSPRQRPETNTAFNLPRPTLKLTWARMNFKSKISTKCSLRETIKVITSALRDHPNGMQWFRESQFGHLFSVRDDIDMSLMPLWMLRCREVITGKRKEIWFMLNGVPIRYSLMEHALISGLNCAPYPNGWDTLGSDDFRDRHFSEKKKITIKDVKHRLERMVIPTEAGSSNRRNRANSNRERERAVFIEDKLRMAVLYFLCSVLMSNEKDETNIDEKCLAIVDNLDACRAFPWGRRSFNYVLAHVEKLDLLKKSANVFVKEKGMHGWGCPGFILPLMLLPFECIPALTPEFAHRKDDIGGHVPRVCHWITKYKKKQAPKLEQIMHAVGDTQDIKSILVPTSEELQAPHMEGFVAHVEPPNAVVDRWMTLLQSGNRIHFADMCLNDVECRRSFLRENGYDEGSPVRVHEERERDGDQHAEEGGVNEDATPANTTRPPHAAWSEDCMRMLRELKAHFDQKSEAIERKLDGLTDMVANLTSSSSRPNVVQEEGRHEQCNVEVDAGVERGDGGIGDMGYDAGFEEPTGTGGNEGTAGHFRTEETDVGKAHQQGCFSPLSMTSSHNDESNPDQMGENVDADKRGKRPKRNLFRSKYKKTPFTEP